VQGKYTEYRACVHKNVWMQRITQRRIKRLALYDAGSLAQEMLELDITLRVNKTKLIARLVLRQMDKIFGQYFN